MVSCLDALVVINDRSDVPCASVIVIPATTGIIQSKLQYLMPLWIDAPDYLINVLQVVIKAIIGQQQNF